MSIGNLVIFIQLIAINLKFMTRQKNEKCSWVESQHFQTLGYALKLRLINRSIIFVKSRNQKQRNKAAHPQFVHCCLLD